MENKKHNWNLKDKDELLELAWAIIANANGGDWDRATKEWKEAAETWRDGYFALNPEPDLIMINSLPPPPKE